MPIKKGIKFSSVDVKKPSTAMRAGITADIRYTSGKELVEHDPWSLIPDPNNPRPNEVINDRWLTEVLLLKTDESLCSMRGKEWVIPTYKELKKDLRGAKEDDYEFLRQLAYSIRNEGIIEPIEIFLADKNHEPEYFTNSDMEYGYAVLEGHQRRLAAMMAGVGTITCIKITDDTLLVKLGGKNKRLKRQLAENNLRKNLSVFQQYQITKKLYANLSEGEELSAENLSSLIGLNIKTSQSLKRLILAEDGRYPSILYQKIEAGEISYRLLRILISKPADLIEKELRGEFIQVRKKDNSKQNVTKSKSLGRQKKSAIFKINNSDDTKRLSDYLIANFPELESNIESASEYKKLELVLSKLLELAKKT